MPLFMTQVIYKDTEVRAMIDKPQNRSDAVKLAVRAFGGKLHAFYYCYGEFDALTIMEFADMTQLRACLMSIVGARGLSRCYTTTLMTAAEGEEAMNRAHEVSAGDGSGYEAPSKFAADDLREITDMGLDC